VRERSTIARLIAVLMALALVAAACGGDDDDGGDAAGEGGGNAQEGGELVDLGTFSTGPPQHIDPALNTELDSYQVVNALYDGLTDLDFSDPENPEVKGLVAESFEPNADATEWTFTIRDGLTFSNGEPVVPTSFQRAWERASNAEFAGVYSYLFAFIEGGQEKLCNGSDAEECEGVTPAETISGVTADDEAMTLTVRLSAPYGNFPAVAGFQLFFPMPSDVDDLEDQNDWENELMIGNGPYKLAEPRSEQEVVLERNDDWGGDILGNDRATLDKITFRVSQDIESAYNAFEAGDGDLATTPAGRLKEADEAYATTIGTSLLATNYFEINQEDPVVGGPDNKLLRQAMSLAIDRDELNEAIWEGTRQNATGVAPAGIPGYTPDGQCDYCERDVEAAQDAFDQWEQDGGSLSGPIRIQHDRADQRQIDMIQIIIGNWEEIGIEAEAEPLDSETYFDQLAEGACQVCASGWIADYPTYDNFLNDLFYTDNGNNHGRYSNPEFDRLVDEAKATPEPDAAAPLFQEAERVLLNDDVGAFPINFQNGDYVFNPDRVPDFNQRPDGIIPFETIGVTG
jgi:oligopeptide transport system substrate-binding protein